MSSFSGGGAAGAEVSVAGSLAAALEEERQGQGSLMSLDAAATKALSFTIREVELSRYLQAHKT